MKLALVAAVAGLVVWHIRRPQLHALEGGIFIGSLSSGSECRWPISWERKMST